MVGDIAGRSGGVGGGLTIAGNILGGRDHLIGGSGHGQGIGLSLRGTLLGGGHQAMDILGVGGDLIGGALDEVHLLPDRLTQVLKALL